MEELAQIRLKLLIMELLGQQNLQLLFLELDILLAAGTQLRMGAELPMV